MSSKWYNSINILPPASSLIQKLNCSFLENLLGVASPKVYHWSGISSGLEENLHSTGRWGMRRRDRQKWGVMLMCTEASLPSFCDLAPGLCSSLQLRCSLLPGSVLSGARMLSGQAALQFLWLWAPGVRTSSHALLLHVPSPQRWPLLLGCPSFRSCHTCHPPSTPSQVASHQWVEHHTPSPCDEPQFPPAASHVGAQEASHVGGIVRS